MKKKINKLSFIENNKSFALTSVFSLVIIIISFVLPTSVDFFIKNIKKNKIIITSSNITFDQQINKKGTKKKNT